MQKKVITDLATEPVTLAEAKAHLVVDFAVDDDLISQKIKVARQWLEEYTGLAFGAKTILAQFDSQDTEFRLPIGPIIGSITSVKRTINGDTTTLATSDYWTNGFDFPVLEFSPVWTSCGRYRSTYAVTYQAGYAEGELPDPLKEAICKLAAELYRDRENSISGTINTMLPHNVRALASPYRQYVWL